MSNTAIWHCQLWMGGLEPYMTETFVKGAFEKLGEAPMGVKIMRNKFTGEPAGYCFVHFKTDEIALDAMHKLNGKVIPGSNPPVRFKLNHASTTGKPGNDSDFSLWIGDLSPEVDDYQLYRLLASRYHSLRTAKVVMDPSTGVSKGYAFVKFSNEEDQKACLIDMNGYKGLGNKPLKISNAVPKSKQAAAAAAAEESLNEKAHAYLEYWQNYNQWNSQYGSNSAYYDHYNQSNTTSTYTTSQYDQQTAAAVAAAAAAAKAIESQPPLPAEAPPPAPIPEEFQLVEHNIPVDIDELNYHTCQKDNQMWDALLESKWLPSEVCVPYL
ncbi:tRNA selenocysteine 1-associated protein 1 [Neocloeon triangulifer]|uniref:tRNA selenocysteine 1-associated protein 1 n=1 Tax=Neocloeon triangulifer TaxID=2078957 RepID=UPI00286F83D2|nr:tRNA selenocysteine 1-associated protein 1 [Neocloeon triangulifer]